VFKVLLNVNQLANQPEPGSLVIVFLQLHQVLVSITAGLVVVFYQLQLEEAENYSFETDISQCSHRQEF